MVRDNASERGWGLVGPPEIDLVADAALKKGDLSCAASLVEGAEKVEPVAPHALASVVVHENDEARTVALRSEVVTIGRLPDCDVVVKDQGASRRHAQIRAKDGVFTLTDLGSTNGTRLNGQTVQSRQLEDGDRITIGATVLDFRRG